MMSMVQSIIVCLGSKTLIETVTYCSNLVRIFTEMYVLLYMYIHVFK